MRRVALASFVGTAIEFYDFFLYGTAAALIFPRLFFSGLSPTLATIASLATFAAAFVSRPLGALFFGHFGDRFGRKNALVATLLIMGISTTAVGLVPPPEWIGIGAPLILLTMRLAQGFAAGGEWAGSAVLVAEYAPDTTRGKYGMFTPLGAAAGGVLSNIAFLVANCTVGETSQTFTSWGWRLPFLFSAVLVLIALYVRLHIAETPVFAALTPPPGPSRAPVAEVLARHRREVFLVAGSVLGLFTYSFMAGTYLLTYAQTHYGYSRTFILQTAVAGWLSTMAWIAVSAIASDRWGRRRVLLWGLTIALLWSLIVVPLIDTGSPALFAVAIVGTLSVLGIINGPVASFIPECFATDHRYSGVGLAFNLAGVIGGAIPPLISAALVAAYGSWTIGVMIAALVTVSLVCTYRLTDTTGTSLTLPPQLVHAPPPQTP